MLSSFTDRWGANGLREIQMASVITLGRRVAGGALNQSSRRNLSWVKDVTVSVTFVNHEVSLGHDPLVDDYGLVEENLVPKAFGLLIIIHVLPAFLSLLFLP